MTIHLVSMLPSRSSDLPGNSDGPPSIVPLFGLAPGGVYLAPAVTGETGELLPHPFTLTPTDIQDIGGGGFLSVALSCPSPGLGVTQHPVLWSPDFPPPRLSGKAAVICTTPTYPPSRPSENALLPKLFVILKKIILRISTICLWLFFQVFLDFEQNCYSRTASMSFSITCEKRSSSPQ